MQATMLCWLSTKVPSQSNTAKRMRASLIDQFVRIGIGGEAERVQRLDEMRRRRRLDVERPALGMRDADAPRVQVKLLGDPLHPQERAAAPIFAVAEDRRAERRHVHA